MSDRAHSAPWWVQESGSSQVMPEVWREVAAWVGGEYVPAPEAQAGVDGVIVTVTSADLKEGMRVALQHIKDALLEIAGDHPALFCTYGSRPAVEQDSFL